VERSDSLMNRDRYVLVHGDVSIGMGQINCDECESELLVSDHKSDENEIKFLCNCVDTSVVRLDRVLDNWAIDVENPGCNRCGNDLEIRSITSGGGMHPSIRYKVSCQCSISGFGVTVSWQTVLPDNWKDDADVTKWPRIEDDIYEYVVENGPSDIDAIADQFDIEHAGANYLLLRLEREHKIMSNSDTYMTMRQARVAESGYTMVSDDIDESDGYSGWFSRILP
jgi:hypothetical protein